jgi:hypothetical protein
MSKQQAQDLFLSITLVAVVIAGTIAFIGFGEYEQARDDHRQSQHKGE